VRNYHYYFDLQTINREKAPLKNILAMKVEIRRKSAVNTYKYCTIPFFDLSLDY